MERDITLGSTLSYNNISYTYEKWKINRTQRGQNHLYVNLKNPFRPYLVERDIRVRQTTPAEDDSLLGAFRVSHNLYLIFWPLSWK